MHIATLAVVWLGAQAAASPAPAPTDADLLRALHEKVMRAHQQSKVDLLLEDEAPDTVFVGRGDVTRPTLEERRTHLGSYLGRTTFSEYRDLVEPVVTVSEDGSLGWVIVQVRANGIQTTESGSKEPIQFVSAWIELYQKRAGRWYRVGNVSNFRP
jgi:Domain of unknown function (DUF4440)